MAVLVPTSSPSIRARRSIASGGFVSGVFRLKLSQFAPRGGDLVMGILQACVDIVAFLDQVCGVCENLVQLLVQCGQRRWMDTGANLDLPVLAPCLGAPVGTRMVEQGARRQGRRPG
jgi:hypothetical protein